MSANPHKLSRLPFSAFPRLPWTIKARASFEQWERESIRILSREEISVGGTALIFRVTYSTGHQEIEKVLIPKYQGQFDFEAAQFREFEILKSLQHPFVVRALRIRTDISPWGISSKTLVLECVRGIPLSNLSPFLSSLSRELREVWAEEIFRQLVTVVTYLRSKGVIHGDLAPDNVLIDSAGFIKVLDFGVSRRETDGPLRFQVAGRNRFRAPELKGDGGTSFEGDIYALGRIYEEVLGEELAESPKSQAVLGQLIYDRELPEIDFLGRGWFQGLSPLPPEKDFEIKGQVRKKTKLVPRAKWSMRVHQILMLCVLLAMTPFISSWLPQRALITVNTWPYSLFNIDKLGAEIRYETPMQAIKIPSGDLEVEFVIPSQQNRRVIRKIRVRPGEHAKLFEDFQNLDTLRR